LGFQSRVFSLITRVTAAIYIKQPGHKPRRVILGSAVTQTLLLYEDNNIFHYYTIAAVTRQEKIAVRVGAENKA